MIEYTYENENARLLMKDIISKIKWPPSEIITEEAALRMYWHLHNNPTEALPMKEVIYVPMFNLPMI